MRSPTPYGLRPASAAQCGATAHSLVASLKLTPGVGLEPGARGIFAAAAFPKLAVETISFRPTLIVDGTETDG